MAAGQSQDRSSTALQSEAQGGVVRVDALRGYCELAAELGGRPEALLRKARIEPGLLDQRHAFIPFRRFSQLLEDSAAQVSCADFGLRLAGRQGLKAAGPLEVAMRNASTVREAYRYCVEHVSAYGTAARLVLEEPWCGDLALLRFDFLASSTLPPHGQAIEHGLKQLQSAAVELSRGEARTREIWMRGRPISDPDVYATHFGAPVKFGQPCDGVVYEAAELDRTVPGGDRELFQLAAHFIDRRFPPGAPLLNLQVRQAVERLLLAGRCTAAALAEDLGLHPRTLQRRLRAEGGSFESIRDSVRRELAARLLATPGLSFARVAEMLGYADVTALARSCQRWFAASPRQLRGASAGRAGEAGAAPANENGSAD